MCVTKKDLTKLLQVNNGILIIPPSLIENIHYYYYYVVCVCQCQITSHLSRWVDSGNIATEISSPRPCLSLLCLPQTVSDSGSSRTHLVSGSDHLNIILWKHSNSHFRRKPVKICNIGNIKSCVNKFSFLAFCIFGKVFSISIHLKFSRLDCDFWQILQLLALTPVNLPYTLKRESRDTKDLTWRSRF